MGRPFRRSGTGVRVDLRVEERELLIMLLAEVDELLDDGLVDEDPLATLVGLDPAAFTPAALGLEDVEPSGGVPSTDRSSTGRSEPDRPGQDGTSSDRAGSDLASSDRASSDRAGHQRGEPVADDQESGGAALDGSGLEGPDPDGVDQQAPEEDELDPALARLLPDGSRADPADSAEFRRLTEHGLRARKRSALATARRALDRAGPVVLDGEEATALLKGLTDIRLVVAERLGLRTDEDAELLHRRLHSARNFDDPWITLAAIYDSLTWWQEMLVAALPQPR